MRVVVGKSPYISAVGHGVVKESVPQDSVSLAFPVELVYDFHSDKVGIAVKEVCINGWRPTRTASS